MLEFIVSIFSPGEPSSCDYPVVRYKNGDAGSPRKVTIIPPKVKVTKDIQEEDDDLEKCFIKVTGMTCSSCVGNVERHVSKMEGEKHHYAKTKRHLPGNHHASHFLTLTVLVATIDAQ